MAAIDLLISSGSGPVECRIALKALLGILEEQASSLNCSIETSPNDEPDRHGPKSALISLEGDAAGSLAAEFCGSVKFVFKSPVRPGHKRQNWFVSVQQIQPVSDQAAELDPKDLRFETLRAGGPGGQHQNTTDSAVRAIHIPTGIRVVARNERSQHRNKAMAIKRIASMLHQMKENKMDAAKTDRFIAQRTIERGNAIRTFWL